MAGESSLAASERMSIGNQLKESKMSATSFGTIGFESSGCSQKNSKQKLQKIKSESEFKSYVEAMKL